MSELIVARRKRAVLRRYTRQLTSPHRKNADREVLYVDPALAKEMIREGLLRDLKNRNPEGIILDARGFVIAGGNVEHHVPSILTPQGIQALHGAMSRKD